MGEVVTGIIQAIETRSVAGGKTAYNIVVGGQSYGAGLYKPKANEGDYVKFEVDDSRGYKNVARNSLKVSPNKAPAEAVEEAKVTAPTKNADGSVLTQKEKARQEWEEKKQEIIARQSALNSANDFLAVAAQVDALGLPASGAKGKRLEALEVLLHKYTKQFYEQSTGQTWKGSEVAPTLAEDAAELDAVAEPDDTPWE